MAEGNIEMEITEVKIIEVGVNIEIRITVNDGLRFYSNYGFETVAEAKEALECYGLREVTKCEKSQMNA